MSGIRGIMGFQPWTRPVSRILLLSPRNGLATASPALVQQPKHHQDPLPPPPPPLRLTTHRLVFSPSSPAGNDKKTDDGQSPVNKEEMLNAVAQIFGKDLICLFIRKIRHEIYTPDLIFEDRTKGKTTHVRLVDQLISLSLIDS